MDNEGIRRLLERIGQALSAGDLRAASICWAFPALLLSDDGTIAVSDAKQIEEFFCEGQ